MITTLGIDFDNTLVSYERLFARLAEERGFAADGGKKAIRDAIRASGAGDLGWQELQGLAYGPRMIEADMMPGAEAFLIRCRELGLRVFIVSHKTEKAGIDPTGTDLRQAARAWMAANGIHDRLGIAPGDVFFEPSRALKITRIASLGLPAFVDDLEEVLTDPAFPAATRRILFGTAALEGIETCPDWSEVSRRIIGT